ncbi:MAG: ABC transporter permease [Chloroflexota bacterium]|nr:ABC transporter permease [Chloroflexota bacterium]
MAAFDPWFSALASGLAFAGLALAVYLTFRVLDFPDLTVDGSLGVGAAVSAVLINAGWNPWLTLGAAMLAGALAGLTTGLLHTRLGINGLLASILVSISMFTINLRVMGGSNVSVSGQSTVFYAANYQPGPVGQALATINPDLARISIQASIVLLILTAIIVAVAARWLNSEQGIALRATGDNPRMIRALGVNTARMLMLGLTVANGLCGLSGALLAQYLGFSDITLGPGSILTGLAAVILGEALLHSGSVRAGLVGAVLGAVLFQVLLAVTQLQQTIRIEAQDYKLASALIVLIALLIPSVRARLGLNRAARAVAGKGGAV